MILGFYFRTWKAETVAAPQLTHAVSARWAGHPREEEQRGAGPTAGSPETLRALWAVCVMGGVTATGGVLPFFRVPGWPRLTGFFRSPTLEESSQLSGRSLRHLEPPGSIFRLPLSYSGFLGALSSDSLNQLSPLSASERFSESVRSCGEGAGAHRGCRWPCSSQSLSPPRAPRGPAGAGDTACVCPRCLPAPAASLRVLCPLRTMPQLPS